jgi:cytochrome c5
MLRIATITLTAAFVAFLALAGCGAREKAAEAAETVGEQPASTAAPYEAEAETTAEVEAETAAEVEAPGKVLLETRCTVCHNLERVQKKRADRAGWEKIVNHMIKKGAKLDDAEREAVMEYLTATYGK